MALNKNEENTYTFVGFSLNVAIPTSANVVLAANEAKVQGIKPDELRPPQNLRIFQIATGRKMKSCNLWNLV